MDRIAAAAGVNKQLLFHYFGSKAGLYRAVAESVASRLDMSAIGGRTPAEHLKALISELLKAADEYRTLLPTGWRELVAERAAQVLREGQRQGYFRDDVDPAALSEVVAATVRGWTSSSGQPRDGDRGDARHRFGDLVASIVTDYCTWR